MTGNLLCVRRYPVALLAPPVFLLSAYPFMEAGFKASTYWVVVVRPIPLHEHPKDAKWLQ